ncbi:MAG: hypothetical protein J6Y39_01590 [Bacteroidaceae bacterium]|nr:hypothetical protein [Bacteroidaceae bacterium]
MANNNNKRNTPFSTLIKNYIDKNSGKVDESRKEIMRRFDYLDWKNQKKILSAFLDSCKTDRWWAYTKLFNCWDKSFEPKLKELWEINPEDRCTWAIIRHMPLDYITENLDKFTSEKDYYQVCLRLGQSKSFSIDKDRLSPADYLSVLYRTKRTISKEEATDLLYRLVHKYCVEKDTKPRRVLDLDDIDYGRVIGPRKFKEVSRALYYLHMLNLDQTAWRFEDWDMGVQVAISESPEYKSIPSKVIDFSSDLDTRIGIAYKYSYLALDDKYKQSSDPDVESMLKSVDEDTVTLLDLYNSQKHYAEPFSFSEEHLKYVSCDYENPFGNSEIKS